MEQTKPRLSIVVKKKLKHQFTGSPRKMPAGQAKYCEKTAREHPFDKFKKLTFLIILPSHRIYIIPPRISQILGRFYHRGGQRTELRFPQGYRTIETVQFRISTQSFHILRIFHFLEIRKHIFVTPARTRSDFCIPIVVIESTPANVSGPVMRTAPAEALSTRPSDYLKEQTDYYVLGLLQVLHWQPNSNFGVWIGWVEIRFKIFLGDLSWIGLN